MTLVWWKDNRKDMNGTQAEVVTSTNGMSSIAGHLRYTKFQTIDQNHVSDQHFHQYRQNREKDEKRKNKRATPK